MSTLELGGFAAPASSPHAGWLARLWAGWRRRRARRLTLLSLARMDPYLLRDIGIEPMDIIEAINSRSIAPLHDPMRRG